MTLRILLLVADQGACGLYRMIMPARAAAASGNSDLEIFVAEGLLGKHHREPDGTLVCDYVAPVDMDIVVYQRPMTDSLVSTIPLIQAQGCTVIVELDDDIVNVPTHNLAYDLVHPRINRTFNWQFLREACKLADWMTCTTPALGERYMPGRHTVVPNYVPTSLVQFQASSSLGKSPEEIVLGWSGSMAVHAMDLQETQNAIPIVLHETDCEFLVVGESARTGAALGLSKDPAETGWIPLPEYPEYLAKLDVGIVPLVGDRFNQAKSWLKGMEMAALGIPFVASPVTEYVRLHNEYHIGILASKQRDWVRELKRLVIEDEYRSDVSGRGRALVQERLTIEGNVGRWIEAWHTARNVAHRRTLHGATSTPVSP